jgi:hypothetical protein
MSDEEPTVTDELLDFVCDVIVFVCNPVPALVVIVLIAVAMLLYGYANF